MKTRMFILFLLFINAVASFAQTNSPDKASGQANLYPPAESLQNISQEISKISKSVQNFNSIIQEFVEKIAAGKGSTLTERQQKLLLGFEILNRAEQRLEVLQKFQIELTQKEGEVKTRSAQVEEALMPDSIERNTAFIGTTRGEELRNGRRQTLDGEKRSLQNLLIQIRRNLTQTSDELQQAESLVNRLRRKILPQVESEISDL